MALASQINRLRTFIHSMHDEGIVNDQFYQLQSTKESIRRDYVVRSVTTFCVSCISLFSYLTDQIYQQKVDFHNVHVTQWGQALGSVCEWVFEEIIEKISGNPNKGVVNDQFNELLSLKNTREPDCVVQLIETYFADVDMILSELSRHVENSKIDFCKLASLAREIEDKSASIGAEHMRLACSDLIKACDEKHKKNFIRTLPWVKAEFTQTRNKLEAIVRMERRIIRFASSQSSN